MQRDIKTGRILPAELEDNQITQIIKWTEDFKKNVVICLIELNYGVSKPTALKFYRRAVSTI
jgi:hypothetical protein